MREDINKLLEIQDIDLKIFELNKLAQDLPEELRGLKKDVESKKNELNSVSDKLKELKSKQKTLELESQTNKANILKYKGQLYQIKNNDQYRAMSKEIEYLEKKNSELDDKILAMMLEAEELEDELKTAEKKLKNSESNLLSGQEQISRRIEQVDKEIDQLRDKRSALKKNIKPQVANSYERILNNKQGQAVVPVIGDTCQGCYMKLTPSDVNEVHKNHSLCFCENCSRILYWVPPEE